MTSLTMQQACEMFPEAMCLLDHQVPHLAQAADLEIEHHIVWHLPHPTLMVKVPLTYSYMHFNTHSAQFDFAMRCWIRMTRKVLSKYGKHNRSGRKNQHNPHDWSVPVYRMCQAHDLYGEFATWYLVESTINGMKHVPR